ncbi:MAG: FmdB family zinc ribbon protein [Roseiflexaceae bacterium]
MPIYEYQCAQCDGHFQRLVRGFSDPADLRCPRCQAQTVTRRMSRVALHRGASPMHNDATLHDAPADTADARAFTQWAKRIGHTLGDEVGTNWNETVEQLIDEEFSQNASSHNPNDLGWA